MTMTIKLCYLNLWCTQYTFEASFYCDLSCLDDLRFWGIRM